MYSDDALQAAHLQGFDRVELDCESYTMILTLSDYKERE